MAQVTCEGKTSREINSEIKRLLGDGETDIEVSATGGRHNLGVAILQEARISFKGSVGYYCAGMIDGPTIEINGSAGWGLAESMMSGKVIVNGNTGNGTGAALRGGTIVIHGDAAARAGVSMKGGLILITGDAGYMSGFMGQKGTIIVCGDTGEGFADSMYATVCYVAGKTDDLGNDTVIEDPTEEDTKFLTEALVQHLDGEHPDAGSFKKVVAGRKLWNFDKKDWKTWKEAL